jgi:hypothetical protein
MLKKGGEKPAKPLIYMVPPHGHQVKPFFKGFASLNLPPRYTRLEPHPEHGTPL